MKHVLWGLRFLIVFSFFFFFIYNNGVVSHASFGDIEGVDGYISYRHNYSLDTEKTGNLDVKTPINDMFANWLFGFYINIVYGTIFMFIKAFTFDLVDLFSKEIKSILEILTNGIFKPLLYLGLAFSFFAIVKRLIQQNFIGIMMEFAKVILLVVLSVALVQKADAALTFVTSTTKNISLAAMNGLNGVDITNPDASSKEVADYAAVTAGMMWDNMLHKPWLSLQFGDGNQIHEELALSLLQHPPGSDARAEIIQANKELFPKTLGAGRIGLLIIIPWIALIKGILFITISFILIVFQVIAMIFVFTAPLVLILAFFPTYQGIINTWFMKFMETQITIFIITLILGLIIGIDSAMFDRLGDWGWLGVMLFQVGIIAVMVWQREKILSSFSNIQHKMKNLDFRLPSDISRNIKRNRERKRDRKRHRQEYEETAETMESISESLNTIAMRHGSHPLEKSQANNRPATVPARQTMTNDAPNNATSFNQYKDDHTVGGQYVSPRPPAPNLADSVNQRRIAQQQTAVDKGSRLRIHLDDPAAAKVSGRMIQRTGIRMNEQMAGANLPDRARIPAPANQADVANRNLSTGVNQVNQIEVSGSAMEMASPKIERPVWSNENQTSLVSPDAPKSSVITASPEASSAAATASHAGVNGPEPVNAAVTAASSPKGNPTAGQAATRPATGRRARNTPGASAGAVEINMPVHRKSEVSKRPVTSAAKAAGYGGK